MEQDYDIIVIGAGHAGSEAAWISAQRGLRTALLTINLDTVAQMSCNPAIGGLAKTHLVREVDMLGGLMANAIDRTAIQYRVLNTNKGPAVRALRAQADKRAYQQEVKARLEGHEKISLKQEMVTDILRRGRHVSGVKTKRGNIYRAQGVIITTGTFMNGLIHVGRFKETAGRFAEPAAREISGALEALGLNLCRLKTGTPPRIKGGSVNFEILEKQPGENGVYGFSYNSNVMCFGQAPCYIAYTNSKTHQVILDNLDAAPLYSGQITGVGPRYCPSIEDKVVRFKEKHQHQLFLEPEGRCTEEYYLNGFPTSIPEDIQWKALRTIKGLERVEIMRPGYAIEYDCLMPNQIEPSLEAKAVPGLFLAGQINGTSGYEEAAAQGLMAGINAANKIFNKPPLVLKRSEAYIGVLIDDLINKIIEEPYRMFTSRAEHRILLREDNVDRRLVKHAKRLSVLREDYKILYIDNIKARRALLGQLAHTYLDKASRSALDQKGISGLKGNEPLKHLLKRPDVNIAILKDHFPDLKHCTDKTIRALEAQLLYQNYLPRHQKEIKKMRDYENRRIPEGFDYRHIPSLGTEAKEKLSKIRPKSIGQASRISGVDPTDISILMVVLDRYAKTK